MFLPQHVTSELVLLPCPILLKIDLQQVTLRNIRTTLVGLLQMLGWQRPRQLRAAPILLR